MTHLPSGRAARQIPIYPTLFHLPSWSGGGPGVPFIQIFLRGNTELSDMSFHHVTWRKLGIMASSKVSERVCELHIDCLINTILARDPLRVLDPSLLSERVCEIHIDCLIETILAKGPPPGPGP
jgi:hypothetical protein